MPKSNLIRQIENLYDEVDTSNINQRLLQEAYMEASKSDDRSTKNGTLLVSEPEIVTFRTFILARGFNHFVDGYGHKEEHHERPLKYSLTEHAERDVIYKAAAEGVRTNGLTLVGHWVACPDCARAIVEAGISKVLCHRQCMERTPDRWEDMVLLGIQILKQGDVQLIAYDGKVGVSNFNNGEVWHA